jgi:inorganic pyrophosphatase
MSRAGGYARDFPGVVEIVVEIPGGNRNKYEYDEATRVFRLDRVLSSAVFYNFDYGYIQGTRADDGDHADAMLLIDEPTFTGCHVWARPVGGLEMRDDQGEDFKVLCVAVGDPLYEHVHELDQVSPHKLREIEHFFETYKLLEDKAVEVTGWRDRDAAYRQLRADRERAERERAEAERPGPDAALPEPTRAPGDGPRPAPRARPG